jgi:hypothetical protein
MRKLILTAVMALAMTALMATSASAAVEVRNGNGELCGSEAVCEVTFDGEVKLDPNTPNAAILKYHCYAEWTIEVDGDGSLYLHDAAFEPYSVNEYCQSPTWTHQLDLCSDLPGQITQQGDDDYVGPGHTEPAPGFHFKHYNAVIESCWRSGYDSWQGGLLGKMRFDIDDRDYPTEYDHLEPPMAWTFDEQLAFTNTQGQPDYVQNATLELIGDQQLPVGELTITSVE